MVNNTNERWSLFYRTFLFNLISLQPFRLDFLLPLYHLLTAFLVYFPLLRISYVHLLSVPGIQFSSKCFNDDTIKYYIGPPDLNSEPNTEVDERETQLGLCRGTAMCFDYC